jgi:hypothetical protein
MFKNCFDKIESTVGGKPLTPKEKETLRQDFSRVFNSTKADPTASDFANMAAAVERFRMEKMQEAQLKARRDLLKSVAENNLTTMAAANKMAMPEFINRRLTTYQDGRTKASNVVSLGDAIYRTISLKPIKDAVDAIGLDMIGIRESAEGAAQFVTETMGKATGNAQVKAAAEGMQKMLEVLRQRANAAGADIGKLDFYLPQIWDKDMILKGWERHPNAASINGLKGGAKINAKFKLAAEVYADDFMTTPDAKLMKNSEGVPMTPQEIRETAVSSAINLMTEHHGTADRPPVGGSLANRGAAHRVLHIGSPEGYMMMMSKYSSTPLLEAFDQMAKSMSRNIAMMEVFGPNPINMIEKLQAAEVDAMKNAGNYDRVTSAPDNFARYKNVTLAKAMANTEARPTASSWQLRTLQNIRTAQVFKLFGAAIPNAFDALSQHYQAAITGRSNLALLEQQVKMLGGRGTPEARAILTNTGILHEQFSSGLYRNMQDVQARGWIGTSADIGMKISGMPRLDTSMREASKLVLANNFGKIIKNNATLSAANEFDAKILQGMGVTEESFAILKQAKQTKVGEFANHVMDLDSLDGIPDAAIAKIIGNTDAQAVKQAKRTAIESYYMALQSEQSMMVIEADPALKNALMLGTQRGTWAGEIVGSFSTFKSFPFAVIKNNVQRTRMMADHYGKGAATAYALGQFATLTISGYGIMTVQNMLSGKDAPDYTDAKNLYRAAMKGGAFGIYGDALALGSQGGTAQSLAEIVAGPVWSDASKAIGLVTTPIAAIGEGKTSEEDVTKTADKMARQASTLARDYIPGTKWWFTKGAFDHMIMQNVQEILSPGYLDRMEDRARRVEGVGYWWKPGEAVPERAPQIGAD